MFFPEMIKIGLPEKINKQGKHAQRIMPVIIFFKMILMKKFYMLHAGKIENYPARENQLSMNGEPFIKQQVYRSIP